VQGPAERRFRYYIIIPKHGGREKQADFRSMSRCHPAPRAQITFGWARGLRERKAATDDTTSPVTAGSGSSWKSAGSFLESLQISLAL
jgi:hypothetical protein